MKCSEQETYQTVVPTLINCYQACLDAVAKKNYRDWEGKECLEKQLYSASCYFWTNVNFFIPIIRNISFETFRALIILLWKHAAHKVWAKSKLSATLYNPRRGNHVCIQRWRKISKDASKRQGKTKKKSENNNWGLINFFYSRVLWELPTWRAGAVSEVGQ